MNLKMAMGYRTAGVSVEGGVLRAGIWGEAGPVILCAHGLTSNHTSFFPLVAALGSGFRVLAPDLRGRGESRNIAGPWGMPAHAADLVALLDHLEIARADVVLGHSMGGFVTAVMTAGHGDRVGSIVLVDGGIPPLDALPDGVTAEQATRALVGPAMTRLDMTFASREAYFDFWRAHPALGAFWSKDLERHFEYDLVGEPPALRTSVRKDAILGDSQSQLDDDVASRSLAAMHGPVRFLRAPRGILSDAPLYPEQRLLDWSSRVRDFSWTTVDDTNHYTILLGQSGARAVAHEILRVLS